MLAMTTVVATTCRMCDIAHELTVPCEGLEAWKSGKLIQEALPELSADQRELLSAGTCPKCWEEMFSPDDRDE